MVYQETSDGDEEEGEVDPIEVLDAKHVDEGTAFLTIQTIVDGAVDFQIPNDSIALSANAARAFHVEDGAHAGFHHAIARREMVLEASATFDLSSRKVLSVTPRSIDVARRFHTPWNSHLLDLTEGDPVEHVTFGPGVVAGIQGEGTATEATVRFESAGDKRLMLAYAPLSRRPEH